MPYRGDRYWETERPRIAEAGGTELRYFREARRLQVHRRFRGTDGEWKTGSVVTVDVESLALSPQAVQLLRAALNDAADMAVVRPGRGAG